MQEVLMPLMQDCFGSPFVNQKAAKVCCATKIYFSHDLTSKVGVTTVTTLCSAMAVCNTQ